jgi:hypothetical protein
MSDIGKLERTFTLTNEQIDIIWDLLSVRRDELIEQWDSAGMEQISAILARLPE